MANVVLIEDGDPPRAALLRDRIAHVPVGDQVEPVRIDAGSEDDHVVQKAQRLGVGPRVHLIDELHQLLGPEDFGGVEAPVDPDDRLTLLGELAGFALRDIGSQRQAPRDLLVPVEVPVVVGRRNDRHVHRPALLGGADLLEDHPV